MRFSFLSYFRLARVEEEWSHWTSHLCRQSMWETYQSKLGFSLLLYSYISNGGGNWLSPSSEHTSQWHWFSLLAITQPSFSCIVCDRCYDYKSLNKLGKEKKEIAGTCSCLRARVGEFPPLNLSTTTASPCLSASNYYLARKGESREREREELCSRRKERKGEEKEKKMILCV